MKIFVLLSNAPHSGGEAIEVAEARPRSRPNRRFAR